MDPSQPKYPAILSASRRTDIPAFYLDWFMAGLHSGGFEVENPYNRRRRWVPARPHEVHSIVLWSKNFDAFLRRNIGEELVRRGYHLFFNFTVNADDACLEPHVPPLEARLQQLAELVRRFGPQALTWRFDPICFYRRSPSSPQENNLEALARIAGAAADIGVRHCITSFVDLYPKVRRRAQRHGIIFETPGRPDKRAVLKRMAATLDDCGIALATCCEADLLEVLGADGGVRPGACIPGDRLARLYGPHFKRTRDRGQRVSAGCGCNLAVDIGNYNRQPCYHDCLFCYARPQAPHQRGNTTESACKSAPSN